MNDDKDIMEAVATAWRYAMVTMIVILCAICCSSCSTKRIVTERVINKTDTVVVNKTRVDSLIYHDSVFVCERVVGDTVFRIKEVTRWRDRLLIRTDTLLAKSLQSDTVFVDKPVPKTVRDKVKTFLGDVAIWILGILLVFFLAKMMINKILHR